MKASRQMQRKIRIGIATDEHFSCVGLHHLIREHDQFRIVWLPSVVGQLIEALGLWPFDVVLVDMACGFPADIDQKLRERECMAPIIRWVRVTKGAATKQPKVAGSVVFDKRTAPGKLLACVEAVMAGRDWSDNQPALAQMRSESSSSLIHVSPREAALMNLAAEGLSKRQIAKQMQLTERSVKVSLSRLFNKLGIPDRLGLALYSLRLPLNGGVSSVLTRGGTAKAQD